jgi:hypothetical protein
MNIIRIIHASLQSAKASLLHCSWHSHRPRWSAAIQPRLFNHLNSTSGGVAASPKSDFTESFISKTIVKTPSTVPNGIMAHSMPATTMQNVRDFRALNLRPATIIAVANVHPARMNTAAITTKKIPRNRGGGTPLALSNAPDNMAIPMARCMNGIQANNAVSPPTI